MPSMPNKYVKHDDNAKQDANIKWSMMPATKMPSMPRKDVKQNVTRNDTWCKEDSSNKNDLNQTRCQQQNKMPATKIILNKMPDIPKKESHEKTTVEEDAKRTQNPK